MELQLFLMQFVYRYATFYGIKDAELFTFENRERIFEKLKRIDSNAYLALRDFIEGQINLQTVKNDEQLKEQCLNIWKGGLLLAKEEAYGTAMWLHRFSRENGISLAGLLETKT